MTALDATHDPTLKSWVDSANKPNADFTLQNLPFGRFRRRGEDEPWRIGVAIGDQILDLRVAREQCPWGRGIEDDLEPLSSGDLNGFMALGADVRRSMRVALSTALAEHSPQAPFLELCLLPQAAAELSLPCRIPDFTDFDAGIHHATNVGRLLGSDPPLPPNYPWLPIACHGRTSSIVPSGTLLRRPQGQVRRADADAPIVEPTHCLDCELELGVLIGTGNELGTPKSMAEADNDWFGLVLLNDWSARDIQRWEGQPLGQFLAKNFATTLSLWVVTAEALAPFRCPLTRPEGSPPPLAYLDSTLNRGAGAIDILLEIWLQTAKMRADGKAAQRLMQSNFRDHYWTIAQLITHHTMGGCNLQTGDLLGIGTPSGPRPEQGGSLLELSAGGRQPITLANGEKRTFLEDGDRVALRGYCAAPGKARVGLGMAVGTV